MAGQIGLTGLDFGFVRPSAWQLGFGHVGFLWSRFSDENKASTVMVIVHKAGSLKKYLPIRK